jgi:hypothetical protein
MDDERLKFIEKAKVDAAKTRAAIEEEFAERQARFDSGKLREIKQRSAAAVSLVYKTKLNTTVKAERTSDDAWNAWADSKIKNALGQFSLQFAEMMGEEVARAQNEQSAQLRGEMSSLKTHLAIIAEGLVKLLDRKK